MWVILPLLAFGVAQDALVITVKSASFGSLIYLDLTCGTHGIAMLCVIDDESRRWDSYIGVPVFSGNEPRGHFPSINGPIFDTSGAVPNIAGGIYTGCNASGAPVDLAGTCDDWTGVIGGQGLVGQAGATGTDWLSSSRRSCAFQGYIYCVKVLRPAMFVGTQTVNASGSISQLDDKCRLDEDYPFTFALVCHPSRNWPMQLSGIAFTDLQSNLSLGYPFNNFSLAAQIMRKGIPGSGTVFTGCNGDLSYAGANLACGGGNLSASAASSVSSNVTFWLNDGRNRSCTGTFYVYCVRSTVLYVSKAPTTGSPTTLKPTRRPTTAAPSNAPTSPTTRAPSAPSSPSRAPSPQPTSVPVVIVLTNATGNATQNVSVPGNVTIIVPNLLFLFGNSTKVVIGRGNLSDFVSTLLLGGGSLVSVDVIVNGEVVEVSDLSVPIEFVMPREASMCEAQRAAATKCVWRDVEAQTWRTDNCSTSAVTLSDGTPATLCKCNHLTDFAVLLDRETPCVTKTADESFLVFAAIYVFIALYCFVVAMRLQVIHERGTWFLRTQHMLIGAVASVRMLSCLRYYELLGDDLVLEAILTALPYLIEFWIFTRLVSTWLGLVEFTLLESSLQWHKIRPWLFGVNIVGSLFTIALFIAFLVQLDYTTALTGTIGIATVYMLLAVTFLYYSSQLVNTMAVPIKRSATTSDGSSRKGWTLGRRILLAGRASAFCFAMQAVSSVLALVLERELIMVFSALFMAFNCIALIGLLMLYYGAVQKGLQSKVAVSSMSRASGHVELVSTKS